MSYTDQRGHRVPSPTDTAQRSDLLALSLSIPSLHTCASETAAAQHVQALAAAGVRATPAEPVYVWRSDLDALRVWDGTRWHAESNVQAELSATGDMPVGNGMSVGVRIASFKAGRVAQSATEAQFGNLYLDYVTFLNPFPTDCVSVTLTPLYGSGPAGWNFKQGFQFCIDSMDKTGFRPMIPGTTTTGNHAFSWIAMGY